MSLPVRLRPLDSGYLQSEIGLEKWKFAYCKAGKVWKGELDKSDVESSASELEQDAAEYSKIASSVFSNVNQKDFAIDLKTLENGAIELAWKKITSSSVKFSLGSVLLRKCDPGEVADVLKNASHGISNLVKDLESVRAQNAEVKVHNERLSLRLDEFAQLKVQLESELFTKFALILNEKKAKIRSLKAKLEDHGSDEKLVESSDPFYGKREESDEELELTPEKKPTKKRKAHSARITVGESIKLDVSKIPRRGNRNRKNITSDFSVASTAGSSAQVLATKYEDDTDTELEPVKNEAVECDDTVDASEMLNNM